MADQITLVKQQYNKAQYNKVIDSNFTQLLQSVDINQNLVPNADNISVQQFFDYYQQLFYSDKEAIENEFGGALEWNELPDGKESYVTVTKEKADFRNENDWNSQFNWLAERLEKLDTVFRKRVRKVDLE